MHCRTCGIPNEDDAGALQASNNAKTWCWVAFGLGLAVVVFQLVYLLLGFGSLFLVPTQ